MEGPFDSVQSLLQDFHTQRGLLTPRIVGHFPKVRDNSMDKHLTLDES